MTDMINVFDMNRRKTAVLQNAYKITESQELNKIYTLQFSLPGDDEKAQFIQPFHYVRYGEDGELYRIIKCETNDDNTSVLNVTCEHVIAVLCDELMFGDVGFPPPDYERNGGFRTEDAIGYILSKQKTKNWVFDECDFHRKFEYLWSQENLLNALYSIPKEFSKAYKWVFDTKQYPWKISLKEIDETVHPEYYIRAELNLLSSGTAQSFDDICTRLYPLGYGEGVNQLTISDENNGVPYLQSPPEIVAKYGIKEKVLVDRRFENAESLKEYAQTMLDGIQEPGYTRSFSVVDLYPMTGAEIDNAKPGDICKFTKDNTIAYVTKTKRVLDEAGNLDIELSTKAEDVVDTIADLADRIRIESVYAQGSTQLYQHSKDANASKDNGMTISLYFPAEMRQINKVMLKVELKRFRSYSKATKTSPSIEKTSSVKEKEVKSTLDGGGSASVNASAGSSSVNIAGSTDAVWNQSGDYLIITSDAAKNGGITTAPNSDSFPGHTHGVVINTFNLMFYKSQMSHTHSVSLNGVGSHSHTVTFGGHSHSFTIPSHSHTFELPAHAHDITPGIYESDENPTKFTIYVNGSKKASVNKTSYDGDITQWLLNDKKQVPRNTWISVEIRPDKLAYVVSSVFVQGFVQSRGGGNY